MEFVLRRRSRAPGRLASPLVVGLAILAAAADVRGELPSPELRSVFPAGGQAGATVELTLDGAALEGLAELRFSNAGFRATPLDKQRFRVTIPADAPPGACDVRAVGRYGASAPRTFVVGSQPEQLEVEPNDDPSAAPLVPLDVTLHGRLDKPGDVDVARFSATRGERITCDLLAERIDSPLLGVLELYDARGRRLAVARGGLVRDPTLVWTAPEDGEYRVKVSDQTLVGGPQHLYRLEIARTPRYVVAFPPVVSLRAATTVRFEELAASSGGPARFIERLLAAERPGATFAPPVRSWQAFEEFAGVAADERSPAFPLAVSDAPVVREADEHGRFESAQAVDVPCDVAGRLSAGDEQDWYQVRLRRGEVVWIEGFAARLGAPVDLDVVVLDSEWRERAHFADEPENHGGVIFPTQHADPAGRFVAPADGDYRLLVRNLIGDLQSDARRVYRLSLRREEPDFAVVAVPRRSDVATGVNVWRGGREAIELLVERRRGFAGPIRVSAIDAPSGVEVREQWIGPEQRRGVLVIGAARGVAEGAAPLQLVARADGVDGDRPVRAGTIVRTGTPTGWSRRAAELTLGRVQDAPLVATATLQQPDHFQGSVVDVAIDLERRDGHAAATRLAIIGLPEEVVATPAVVPAGETRGWLSAWLPPTLPVGSYSFAVQVESEALVEGRKTPTVTFSGPLDLHVDSARIHVTIDPSTPKKIARGQVIHVKYKAERRHGFIGKIHTELAAPGGVVGVRGRGVTFTGQTETGDIQVIATENATPGTVAFLRLEAVGTVEDRPAYRGGKFVELEITP